MGETPRTVLINNSVAWHSGIVASDQVWTADKVHVIEGTLIIPSGVHVTINSGVVVKAVKGVPGLLSPTAESSMPSAPAGPR